MSAACGAHDRAYAWEQRCKKLQRAESTREYQRTGGNQYSARVLAPDGEEGPEWQEVRAADGYSQRFATAEEAIAAAERAITDHSAIRAKVLHWTIEIASECGWRTNDVPVWMWRK